MRGNQKWKGGILNFIIKEKIMNIENILKIKKKLIIIENKIINEAISWIK